MEKDFRNEVKEVLSHAFNFYPEIKGTHFSGKRLIVDFVITPKDTTLWKNKNVAFGLEFKDTVRLDGDMTNFTRWIAQCADYTNTNWDNYGYLYILACPAITSTGFIKGSNILTHLMGHLGLGELKKFPRYGWSLTLQDTHRIWSELNGVESGKHWSLERKFGSR